MLELFAHPFSSYCQKALIALYANDTPFTFRMLGPDHLDTATELARRWPFGQFPVLADGARTVPEASIIIEYLDRHHPGAHRFVPEGDALEIRLLDRVFDNRVMTPVQKLVGNAMRPFDKRDPTGVEDARKTLDTAYAWLDAQLAGRTWAAGGDTPTLADCAAAPSLFYADWAHPIPDTHATLRAYRANLLAWAPFTRCVEEARPYRHFFPLGAPDRD
ncbi:glutathione S-transferase family protein [Sphingomonas sp. MMS24-J45]|uniref:glutathione S-transferase family protein n=1 Tax=Sphingomonas sp. MMS24-J45 TaxID=3238806 RepID=UPI00384CB835